MHLFSFLFRIFADNMQILLASAKIMNDRSATKGDACQSKKVNVLPDLTLYTPAFRMHKGTGTLCTRVFG